MNLEKFDIIKMGDNKNYTIAEILDLNKIRYLSLIEIDEQEELLDNTRIAKVVANTSGDYGLEDIKDEKELVEVQGIFLSMMEIDY